MFYVIRWAFLPSLKVKRSCKQVFITTYHDDIVDVKGDDAAAIISYYTYAFIGSIGNIIGNIASVVYLSAIRGFGYIRSVILLTIHLLQVISDTTESLFYLGDSQTDMWISFIALVLVSGFCFVLVL